MAKYYTRLWGKDLSESNGVKAVAQPVWYAYRGFVEDGANIDFSKERRLFKAGDKVMMVPLTEAGELDLGSAQIKDVTADENGGCKIEGGVAGEVLVVKAFADKLSDDGVESIVPVTREMLLADQASEDKPLRNLGIVSSGWWRFSMHLNEAGDVVHIRAELLASIKHFDSPESVSSESIGAPDIVANTADLIIGGNGDDDFGGNGMSGDDEP